MKRKNCKVCGKDSGRRSVCKNCKEEQPYVAAAQKVNGIGGKPFVRK